MTIFSTQMDKIKRNIKKCQDGDEQMADQIRKLLYCCIGILLMVLLTCIYLAISLKQKEYQSSNSNIKMDDQIKSKYEYSSDVMELKGKFLTQLENARENPKNAFKQRIPMPENPLFIRTKTVKLLYDYVEAATRELYQEQYNADPNYHHIECLQTFTPGLEDQLKKFEEPVKQFLSHKQSIFTQEVIKQYASREKITEQNNGNLEHLTGQYGVIAKKTIPELTCIGHFYGDEYLLFEYEAAFPWNYYGPRPRHPFRKKWDYYMVIPNPSLSNGRFDLPTDITLTMDAYHSYNYADYVKEGGQNLTEEQSKLKENLEGFVNDAREELYKPELQPKDEMRRNSEFVYCSVDGRVLSFLITMKEIKENEQVFVYYGPSYGR